MSKEYILWKGKRKEAIIVIQFRNVFLKRGRKESEPSKNKTGQDNLRNGS